MQISVIIPSYNKAPYVKEAIQSVLDQTHPTVEIIVVDDGSTDESWSIIQSFGDKIQAVRQENQGACRARNRGAHLASGDALMFLDADDVITSDTLSALGRVLENEGSCIAACPWAFLSWNGSEWMPEPNGKPPTPPNGDFILGWLSGWFVPPCGLLWAREAYEKTEGWDEDLSANQDGDLVLRALLNGVKIIQTEDGQAFWRNFNNTDRITKSRGASREDLLSRIRSREKIAARLQKQGQLAPYAVEIAQDLHQYAKRGFNVEGERTASYLRRLEDVAKEARELAGYRAINGTFAHRITCYLFGLRTKEQLASALARLGIGSQIRRKHSSFW